MNRSVNAFFSLTICLLLIGLTGCEISFNMVDGYSFDRTGETAESIDEGSFDSGINAIEVENKFGFVNVETADGEPSWNWESKVWAENKELADLFMAELEMVVSTEGETQTLKIVLPEPNPDLNGIESNLTLKIPADVTVNLTNAHGDVSVANVGSEVELLNRHGNVSLNDLSGNLAATNSHGNLKASSIVDAKIKVSHGRAELDSAIGKVSIENSHGSVKATNIEGEVTVEGSHSSVSVNDITGNVTTENSHGSTKIQTFGSQVKASSTHGSIAVTVNNAAFGMIDLETSHASIKLSLPADSEPDIDMETTHAGTKSEFSENGNSNQKVKLRNQHGQIAVKKLEPTAEVTN